MIEDESAILRWADLAVPGLYAFANHPDRRIDIRHAANVLEGAARHITQIGDGTHECRSLVLDRAKLTFVFLERVVHRSTRLHQHSVWCHTYQDKGYTLYRTRRAWAYRVEVLIEDWQARVKLINENHIGIVMGCFPSLDEAHSFVEHYYKQPPYPLVYAANDATRAYYAKRSGAK